QFRKFTLEWPQISERILVLIQNIKTFLVYDLGFSQEQVELWSTELLHKSASSSFAFLETTLFSMAVNAVMLVLIPIYTFLILYYRHQLVEVIYSLFSNS